MPAPPHHRGSPCVTPGLLQSRPPHITCAFSHILSTPTLCSTRRTAGVIKNTAITLAAVLNHPLGTLDRKGKAKTLHWSVHREDRTNICKCRIKEICTNWTRGLTTENGAAVTLGAYIKKTNRNRREYHFGVGNEMVKTWICP